mmetsp:Transcript_3220/g.10854  ORF Transcript_3220/g.10854 Transcript_3220/m.10854 type:complete len:211 (+) Transcript_3220:139-771(+)
MRTVSAGGGGVTRSAGGPVPPGPAAKTGSVSTRAHGGSPSTISSCRDTVTPHATGAYGISSASVPPAGIVSPPPACAAAVAPPAKIPAPIGIVCAMAGGAAGGAAVTIPVGAGFLAGGAIASEALPMVRERAGSEATRRSADGVRSTARVECSRSDRVVAEPTARVGTGHSASHRNSAWFGCTSTTAGEDSGRKLAWVGRAARRTIPSRS